MPTKSQTDSQTFEKYTVTLADIQALGAVLTGDILLETLPKGTIVTHVVVKPTTALAGTAVSTATARVTTPSVNFGTAYDVKQAVGAGVRDFDGVSQFLGAAAAVDLRLTVTITTSASATLASLTAGQIDVYFEVLNIL